MATDAQTAANRLNARQSTGPRSPEGKDASRRNAVKHGLSGSAGLLPDGGAEAVAVQLAAYRTEFRPSTAVEEELVAQAAVESVRLERCRDTYVLLCRRHAERATLCWDDDRRLAAEELAARMHRDPARVNRLLRSTRQGCELLIDRWEGLSGVLRETGGWSDTQHALALDLLGVPVTLRDGVSPFDPTGDARAARAAVVDRELSDLRELKAEVLDPLDAAERSVAETSLGAEMTPPLVRLHRYESACWRRQHAAFRALQQRRAGGATAAPVDGRSTAPPPHRPPDLVATPRPVALASPRRPMFVTATPPVSPPLESPAAVPAERPSAENGPRRPNRHERRRQTHLAARR